MNDLDQFIDRATHLPPAPTLLPELLKLLGEPDTDGSRIVRLINFDPALTANVLRLCNSALLSPATPVRTVDEAVVRVGFNEIYRLVITSAAVQSLRNGKARPKNRQNDLWAHSVITAVAAQLIARDQGEDENLAFTAALLHDIGKIVVLDVLEDRYERLFEEVEANKYSLIESERRVFGVQHAELGGRLLARWKFPLNLVTPVCFHHDPLAAVTYKRLAAYVCVGNSMAYAMGYGCGDSVSQQQLPQAALALLRMDEPAIAAYLKRIQTAFDAVEKLIAI